MIWKILDREFFRLYNIFTPQIRFSLMNDIKKEYLNGQISECVPPYQTEGNIFKRYIQKDHWQIAYNFFKNKTEEFKGREVYLKACWANISNEENDYGIHTHDTDITCVYYVKGLQEAYGTNIDRKVIIPFVENSSLIFDGSIPHGIINMPYEIACRKINHRYTLVFDFNYVEKPN